MSFSIGHELFLGHLRNAGCKKAIGAHVESSCMDLLAHKQGGLESPRSECHLARGLDMWRTHLGLWFRAEQDMSEGDGELR